MSTHARHRFVALGLHVAVLATCVVLLDPSAAWGEANGLERAIQTVNARNVRLQQKWQEAVRSNQPIRICALGGCSAGVHAVSFGDQEFVIRSPRRGVDLGYRLHAGAQRVAALCGMPALVTPAFVTQAPCAIGDVPVGSPIMVVRHLGGKYHPGSAPEVQAALATLPESVRLTAAVLDLLSQERDRKSDNVMVKLSQERDRKSDNGMVKEKGSCVSLIDWDNAWGTGADRDAGRGVMPSAFHPGYGSAMAYTSVQNSFTDLPEDLRRAVQTIKDLGDCSGIDGLARALGLSSSEANVAYAGATSIITYGLRGAHQRFMSDKKVRSFR